MVASIEDVARAAGVSVATVSRALRGLPNVAPGTRDRVVEAATRLHYVADPHASRLAARRSATVGLVVPMLSGWYHARLFSGVESVMGAAGYDVLPYVVLGAAAKTEFLTSLPFRKRVDGLIIVDTVFDGPDWERISEAAGRVVTVGCPHGDEVALSIDNRGAARVVTEHLLSLGHRRIGLIGGESGGGSVFPAPRERAIGYREALAGWEVPVDAELLVPAEFSLRGGAEAMSRLLSTGEPPTAVFAMSDEMAIGALQVARDAGLQVPRDLSVAGFDDHDVAEYVGLTTVRQEVVEQGEQAATSMLELLTSDQDRPRRELHMPTRLVVRATTAQRPRRRRTRGPRRG